MDSVKFKLVSVFFKLSSTLKQELGKDMSRKVVGKTKSHYNELDRLKPKEKGIMSFHRTLLVLGLALYRAMQDELGDRNERFFTCPSWEKVEVELENGVGWDQHKCPYYDFFKDEDEVGLTKAYCDLDRLVAGLVLDHVELIRNRTLADVVRVQPW
jgi:hypothetical protein